MKTRAQKKKENVEKDTEETKEESISKKNIKNSKRVKIELPKKSRSPSPESRPVPRRGGCRKRMAREQLAQSTKTDKTEPKPEAKQDAKADVKADAKADSKTDVKQSPKKQKPKEKAKPGRKPKRVVESESSSEDQQPEIKKVVMKGKVPVDQYFDRVTGGMVLEHNGKIYSATLNQTNMDANSNKYYLLQIIQDPANKNCWFWTRWGRVGVRGQTAVLGPLSITHAIAQYDKKYRDKHIKGQYRQLGISYGDDEQEKKDDKKASDEPQKERAKDYDQSQLQKPVKDLVKLIFDLNMMNQQMKEIGYDAKKMPLGKLDESNIKKGYGILKDLLQAIKNNDEQEVKELNNDFFSYIPHDFGFQNMRFHMLDTENKVLKKLQMLESLAEIKVATKILGQDNKDANVIDSNYSKLNRDIKVLAPSSKEFEIIEAYIKNTHADTHRQYSLEIEHVFKLHNEKETQRYTKDIHNKMLLWHGSRLTNYVGILSQGLRIAPPEAPVTGYMFGKGVYFADMVSKSANYCFTNRDNNTGIMLLCEVALGQMNEKTNADYYANLLPPGKHSTKGVGRTYPPTTTYIDLDGMHVPLGPPATEVKQTSLLYNEYIVYDIAQIRLKYLLRLKFNYR